MGSIKIETGCLPFVLEWGIGSKKEEKRKKKESKGSLYVYNFFSPGGTGAVTFFLTDG